MALAGGAAVLACVMIVGEEVCCRVYLGLCSLSARCPLFLPPGEGRGGICPVFSTDIDLGWSAAVIE